MKGFHPLMAVLMVWLFQVNTAQAQHNYIIKHYSNENGLPANGIKGFELDKQNGFLWIGTMGGLVRFDGRNFTNFAANKNALINSRVSVIARNREGRIFFGNNIFSVSRIERHQPMFVFTDTFFTPPPFNPANGGYEFQAVEKVAEKLRSLKPSSFLPPWALFHDEKGDSSSFSFIHCQKAYSYNAATRSLLHFPGYDQTMKLNKDIYFARPGPEIAWYNDSLGKLQSARIHGLPNGNKRNHEKLRLLWMPGMEDPLLIDQQDIYKLTGSKDSIRLIPICRACCPKNSNITCVRIWEEQNIFFLGSETNGLYVVQTQFMRPVRAEPTIEAGKEEYAQVEITPGTVVTGSGLSFTTQGTLIQEYAGFRLPRTNIFQDSKGDCWFSEKDTIYHRYQSDGHVAKIPVYTWAGKTVFAEMNNRIYMIFDLGIVEIADDHYKILYKLPGTVNNSKDFIGADAVLEWKPGILAIAATKLLLFRRDRPAVLDTIHIPGLTTNIRTLYKHGDYLLIGTYGQGFYLYKNGIVKKMPLDKNGYLSHAHCFVPDKNGYCWISTNHGLFKTSLQTLITAWENNLTEIYYQYFGKNDGIFNTELNGGCQPCALKLSNGLLSFPSMNGMVVFDPLQSNTPPPNGKIFIDHVWVDSAQCSENDDYLQTLPYHIRNLRFTLTVPYFGNPESIYFSYKLAPYHNKWETQDIMENNTIQFGGLKPGNYTLYLRIRNGFEPSQFVTTTITFRILKPWYQSWWLYTACILALIALMVGAIKWRTAAISKRKEELQELVTLQTKNIEAQSSLLETQLKQLQAQQEMLEEDNNIKARLIGIISHDMISPLKFMGYMSKRLREAFKESDPSYKTATFIINVAQELESLSVNILNWIKFHHQSVKMKPEKFNLHGLVTETVEIPAILAKEKGLNFQINVPPNTTLVQHKQALGVILYNLSMNAMKYTEKGGISIKSESREEWLILTVTDTGPGMPSEFVGKLNSTEPFVAGHSLEESSKYQFGYVIIKDLLRLANGIMEVSSIKNKGTTVVLQFRKIPEESPED